MKTALTLSAVGLALALGPDTLVTRYATERQLAIESETRFAMETVEFNIERDGERMDTGRVGGSSRAVHRISQVDRFLKVDEDGAPERVRRRYTDIGGERRITMGDQDIEGDVESPFDGLELELARKGSGVEARVASGRRPEGGEALEGHRLGLALDALLPKGKVQEGMSWKLEDEAIRTALGVDLTRKLFPRPAPEERDPEERGRGGRGGARAFGGGGGSSAFDLLGRGAWSGTAKLVDLDHDHDGRTCARIELELEVKGELPERAAFGGGRGGRGGGSLEGLAPAPALSSTFEIELTGTLLFDVEAQLPLKLELEGDVRTERDQEMSGGRGGSMRIHHVEQGTLRHVVTITPEAVDAD